MRAVASVTWAMIFSAAVVGCRSSDAAPQGTAQTASAAQPASTGASAPSAGGPVATIVFVGQKEACDCTRGRIDGTWAALQKALEGRSDIEVKRLQRDVQEDEADRYDEMKSVMVAPGVYFLDRDAKLIQMLQGELSTAQLQAALGSGPQPTATTAPAS